MIKQISFLIGVFLMFCSCEEIFFEEDFSEDTTELITPTTTIYTKSVDFSWKEIEGATTYQLQIANPDFLDLDNMITDTEIEDITYTEALDLGSYEWRVRAKNETSTGIYGKASFLIIDNPDFTEREVELQGVEDGLVTTEATQTLSWLTVTDATLYRLQILDATNNVLLSTTIDDTEIEITFPEEGFQYWQVQAENSENQLTDFDKRSITIDTEIPNDPELTSPTDETTLTETTVSFEWERDEVDGSEEFDDLYIYTSEDLDDDTAQVFEEVESDYEVTLDEGTYYWLIKSYDAAGNENETSEVFSVTIN